MRPAWGNMQGIPFRYGLPVRGSTTFLLTLFAPEVSEGTTVPIEEHGFIFFFLGGGGFTHPRKSVFFRYQVYLGLNLALLSYVTRPEVLLLTMVFSIRLAG
jgi:hypothetical protein